MSFVSLGCPKNLVDSEQMLGTLAEAGCRIVSEGEAADAVVINTCGFLEASKEESLEVIREAIARKQAGELKRVVVAGCLVQRHRAKLLEWAPGIDAMIGVFDRDHIEDAVGMRGSGDEADDRDEAAESNDYIEGRAGVVHGPAGSAATSAKPYWIAGNAMQAARQRGMKTVGLSVRGDDGRGIGYFEDDAKRFRLTPRHWAYLRVSEGCNQKCAFCTIPSIRGKMRSKPLERITSEARRLMSEGAFEINLIGQDTTSYGYDIYPRMRDVGIATETERYSAKGEQPGKPLPYGRGSDGGRRGSDRGDLVGLLQSLDSVAREFGGGWVRLMYVYPTYFNIEMIDAIASLPNIVKYIDIPLQHMSDRMLRSMRRNISRREQEELLWKLRERIEGVAIRTTFITGFPGETEEDHEELLEFIEGFQFDMLGVFRYSREPGTPAGTMDLDAALHVPEEVKRRREEEIMLTQQRIAFDNARYVAEERCEFDVLIDRPASVAGEAAEGRCYHQAPQVDSATRVISNRALAAGELVRCTIVDADGYDLIARPTVELERRTNLPILG